ncbi:MAG TPA: hypothetical protein VHZ31_03515 [Solirubrobacteraceae bacterium]|jgi:hypothetical protein|nr:hypothetical protein [Solirubrobacteraceae bacterium]
MTTTVTLGPDVAAAVESVRRERHVGVSAAVDELIRSGLARPSDAVKPFAQRTSPMHARMDVASIAEVLDGPAAR